MYCSDDISSGVLAYWEALPDRKDVVLAVFVGEESANQIPGLIEAANSKGVKLFGGLFPAVISGKEHFKSGAVIVDLPSHLGYLILTPEGKDEQLKSWLDAQNLQDESYKTAITLVDGLMSDISSLLASIHNRLGVLAGFFGGGAGSLSLQQAPCIFSNEGFFQNGAVVCVIDQTSKFGIKHGWERLSDPIVATKTKGNTIFNLNWRNAFEVYKEIVEKDSGKILREDNFFEIAKGYPFGIYREGQEDVVRDPISTNKMGALHCVGEVPENAVLHVLKGNAQNLIASAKEAAEASQLPGKVPDKTLLVDCISRVIFLGEHFKEELDAVGKVSGDIIPEGILSLGEICSEKEGVLTFFNKTMVASTLYR